jgi:hypothetical protein
MIAENTQRRMSEVQNSINTISKAAAELTPDGAVLLGCGLQLIEPAVDPAGQIQSARGQYTLNIFVNRPLKVQDYQPEYQKEGKRNDFHNLPSAIRSFSRNLIYFQKTLLLSPLFVEMDCFQKV